MKLNSVSLIPFTKDELGLELDYENSGFSPSDNKGYIKLLFRFRFSAKETIYLYYERFF